MDHVPSPAIGSRPPFDVPLLCRSRCVPGHVRFGAFPSHFATAVLPTLDGETQSTNENLLNLVQTWLYFYVVSEFFGQELDPSAFSKAGTSGDLVLCSLPLQQLRRDWFASQTLASPEDHQRTSSKCIRLLAEAVYACEQLEVENLGINGLNLILISVRILLSINEDQMMEIIEQGGIPLIESQTILTDSSSVKLIKHRPRMEYTAISHVWADGLGNPLSNAMSRCQLERLLSQIRAMQCPEKRHEPIRLWIDTFCIPVVAHQPPDSQAGDVDNNVQSRRRHELKQEAIRMMTVIYTAADAVLALDSELQSTSAYDISFAELSARAHVCGWKGRAWTLQEGAFGLKLGYQFNNGVIFTTEAQKMYNESIKIAMWNRTFDEHFQLLKDCRQSWFLPSIGRHKADKVHGLSARDVQLMEVWNSLIGKSTTKSDDFFEIVAK
ncbi:uncharacterized protein PG998_000192 [Apiospora kogelbergensis]|uniref:uncharacterized protein n=1 Tax=Apiospora kogelbergensis TaxID=1337665 RepID=UPI0031317C9B